MSSRLVATALPMRSITRTVGIASARCSHKPNSNPKPVDRKTIRSMTLNDSTVELPAKVLSSPTASLARSLSRQITSSIPSTASLPWPVNTFAQAFEEDRKLGDLCKTFISGVQQGKTVRAGPSMEDGLWLERFGGPGKMLDQFGGRGAVVKREAGLDGRGYLRVLI
ncbi:hypothetical protein EKO04_009248 [Ascochyta lentis]|uniref:Uncharacterized protein n=1 Tax=Ascochyta lentis TaxID=205686 RepID=A0A8H7IXI8_9PLEO|nr:hypothetical protein EKO04_009248 [Ascochyta lentis]